MRPAFALRLFPRVPTPARPRRNHCSARRRQVRRRSQGGVHCACEKDPWRLSSEVVLCRLWVDRGIAVPSWA